MANRLLTVVLDELAVSGIDALRSVDGDVLRAAAVSLFHADTVLRETQ